MTAEKCAALDERLRTQVSGAIADGADPDEVAVTLLRMLPELGDRRWAHGHVEAAYDLHHRSNPEIDRSLPDTQPFDRD